MLSVVIPVYNSEKNILELIHRLGRILKDMNFEVIFVDDASTDRVLEYLSFWGHFYPWLKVISLSRNFGQQAATTCGLQYATGDAVVIMDDDLQDPPELIPQFIEKWKEGYDVVYGIRVRQEGGFKAFLYKSFYRFFNKISYQPIPIDSGDFGLMSRRVVDLINSMPEHSRLVRGLRSWVGFKQIGIPYERYKRTKGKSGYNLKKLLQFVMYSLLAFSNMPLYVSFACSMGALLLAITNKSLILLVSSLQLFCLGILGKYLVRITDEVNKRPLYVIKEKINCNK